MQSGIHSGPRPREEVGECAVTRRGWQRGVFTALDRAPRFMSGVSCAVVFGLLLWVARPTLLSAQEFPTQFPTPPGRIPHTHPETHDLPPKPVEYRLSEGLRSAEAALAEAIALPAGPERWNEVEALRDELIDLRQAVSSRLGALGAQLARRGYPEEILSRHRQARAELEARADALTNRLLALAAAPAEERLAAATAALDQLRAHPLERPHQALDPARLPFGRVTGTPRSPRTSPQSFAAPGSAPSAAVAPLSAPQPEDLDPDVDVQITPAITALADSLDGDPLAIYRWVHENIEFVPTFGSIQGSRMTLEAGRGNAYDIASLLVALLRSSGVPSRFVEGTVQVPVGQVQNWLGDVATPGVAQQVLGQGGIPNVGLLSGGQLSHIRLEHVWVEALVDYVPSRGARSDDAGDTWVPLDPSFKQYTFTPPVGLFESEPFDLQGLSDAVLAGAEVDEDLGLVADLDEDLIYAAMEDYAEQAGAFFGAGGYPPTRESLLGSRTVIPADETVLAGSLPYRVLAAGEPVATLPGSSRVGVSVRGFSSQLDRAFGNTAFEADVSLPEINSRRLGLTYEPATAADAQVLEDARNSNASSLPIYLVQVRPVLTLDDEVLATGPAVPMGQFQFVDVVLRDIGDSATVEFQVTAGDESVFVIDGNGFPESVVQARYDAVPSDTAKENLHQTGLNFWMESDFFGELTAQSLGVQAQRRLSVGLFSSPLTVSYLFGVPRSGLYVSRLMDVKRSLVGVAGEDPQLVKAFVEQSGLFTSYLEGLVHDQLFSEDHIARGFSAIDLIGDANRQGIPTYFITSDNVDQVVPLLQVGTAVRNDVINSVNAGKTVLIPERELDRADWRGVGYIVRDAETGAGAYLISGGLSGGFWSDCVPDLQPLVEIIFVILLILLLILILIAIIKSLGTLGPVLQPALAAIVALIAVIIGSQPAYAQGGFNKGGQADPKNCPPLPPPPPCQFHTDHEHYPCVGANKAHWHYFTMNQNRQCQSFPQRHFGGCGPPPVPCPPC